MSISQINLGTYPNDGQGDDLRTAFEKTISNFNYLNTIDGQNLGTGEPVFAGKTTNPEIRLRFKSFVNGDNIFLSSTGETITISTPDSINSLEEDLNPRLGGNLDLNGKNIIGTGDINIEGEITADFFTGDLEGTVYGNVFGNVTGSVVGNLIGNVTGNVTGQVSDISNHLLNDLGNVDTGVPTTGQVLTWSGSVWQAQTVSGGGSITELNTFDFGNFTNIFTNPIFYLLNQVGLDFGTFISPSQFTIELGSF